MTLRPLRDYQKRAFAYCLRQKHPALFMEMRLGKTLVAIRRCLLSRPRSPSRGLRVLVVAPNSALGSWEDELAREGQPWVRLRPGPAAKEAWLHAALPRFFLANKEAHLHCPEMAEVSWDAVVLDESTFVKNPTARVTKHFLRGYRAVPRRMILTGTPAPEGPEEYWCQMAFLHGRFLDAGTFWQFRARMMEPHPAGFGWVMRPGAASAVQREVATHAFVLRRQDVGLKENKVRETRWIEMPEKIRTAYRRLEREFVLELEEHGVQRKTVWAGAQWQMLRQLCGGIADGRLVWPGKLNVLRELLAGELRRDRAVVWFSYNAEVHAALAAMREDNRSAWAIEGKIPPAVRDRFVQCWRTVDSGVLLVQQAVAQTGMNLSASDTAIYYSEPVSGFARMQTEDRILSVEKAQCGTPLLYLDLCVRGTVDEDVREMMREKRRRSDDEVRRILYIKMKERSMP